MPRMGVTRQSQAGKARIYDQTPIRIGVTAPRYNGMHWLLVNPTKMDYYANRLCDNVIA